MAITRWLRRGERGRRAVEEAGAFADGDPSSVATASATPSLPQGERPSANLGRQYRSSDFRPELSPPATRSSPDDRSRPASRARPVARLDRKAARHGAVIGGQHVAVGAFRHVASRQPFRCGPPSRFRRRRDARPSCRGCCSCRRAMRARQRDHAAERMIAAGELFGGGLEQAREGRPGIDRGVIEDGEEPLARPFQIGRVASQ